MILLRHGYRQGRALLYTGCKTSSRGRVSSRRQCRGVSAHTPHRETACLEGGLVEMVSSQLGSSGKHCSPPAMLQTRRLWFSTNVCLYNSCQHPQRYDSCEPKTTASILLPEHRLHTSSQYTKRLLVHNRSVHDGCEDVKKEEDISPPSKSRKHTAVIFTSETVRNRYQRHHPCKKRSSSLIGRFPPQLEWGLSI
jgi:hypothetical protein